MASVAAPAESTPDSRSAQPQQRIAYMMTRFPKLSETFILFEMLALEQQGHAIEVFPLLRARNSGQAHPEGASVWRKCLELFHAPAAEAVMHPEAKDFVERAHFAPFLSLAILWAQVHFLLRSPLRYLGALATLVRANLSNPNYLLGGLALFPKAIYFARQMQQLQIDHLHAHFANHPAAAAYVIHRVTGIPYTFTAHGADLQVYQEMLREKVAAAHRVITISKYNQQFILDYCGEAFRDRVEVIYCGVDTSHFAPREAEHRAADRPFTLTCIGTMYEVKGHKYLIEACRLLQEQKIPFICHLVGDGPLEEELRAQVAAAGLTDAVRFRGRLTRQQIAALHTESDVLVTPSVPTQEGRREGIPVVLMEGMASGLPVVASNISGIPELVEHQRSGLLIPPRDADALFHALSQLAQDAELRTQLGAAARERVETHFNLFTNAAKLAHCFQQPVQA